MSSMTGEHIRISIFGQSHGEAIGVVVDGLPAGEAVDRDELQRFMERRAPGRNAHSTARREADVPRFLSGLVAGKTCGAPLCAVIENQNTRSEDYAPYQDLPRPGTADYPALMRDKGHADLRGSGHFSGRLTAPLCIAGGIAQQLLARRGIHVGAHILSIGDIRDEQFDPVHITPDQMQAVAGKGFPVMDDAQGGKMREAIAAAAQAGDSLGGTIECAATGLPAGLGSPMFGGVENRLSAMLFGIPAVRGLSFGAGFDAAAMTGSAHNDAYTVQDGHVATRTNHHGGILGGITTGMPLLLTVAIKPTPSIAMPQQTVRLSTMTEETIAIQGRHDPCIVPRAVPCVEAATALVLLDLLLGRNA